MPTVSVKGEEYHVVLDEFTNSKIGYWATTNVNGKIITDKSSLAIKNWGKAKENALDRIETEIWNELKRQDEL